MIDEIKELVRELKNPALLVAFGAMIALVALLSSVRLSPARDSGQWQDNDVSHWYKSLMQPDNENASCCGEADAYWCDDISVRHGKTYCRITDPRPDDPRGRPHREIGEEFEIPPNKLKWDAGNPTGHAIVFLRVDGAVWCFIQNGGV
jgi:hypothetical protein